MAQSHRARCQLIGEHCAAAAGGRFGRSIAGVVRADMERRQHGCIRSMNLKRRYLCVLSVAGLFAVVCCLLVASLRRRTDDTAKEDSTSRRRHYVGGPTEFGRGWSTGRWNERPQGVDAARHCRMSTCFDVSRCRHGFTVYVYPSPNESAADLVKNGSADVTSGLGIWIRQRRRG